MHGTADPDFRTDVSEASPDRLTLLSDPGVMLADRDYDSFAVRQGIRDSGQWPIDPLQNRIDQRMFHMKSCQLVATRYDLTTWAARHCGKTTVL